MCVQRKETFSIDCEGVRGNFVNLKTIRRLSLSKDRREYVIAFRSIVLAQSGKPASSHRKRNITRQHSIRQPRGNTASRFTFPQSPSLLRHEPSRDAGNGESRRGEEEEEEEEGKRRRGGRLLRPRRLPHPPRGRRAKHRAEPTRLLLLRRRRAPPAPPSLPITPGAAAFPSPRTPRRAPTPPPHLQLAFCRRAELRGDGRGGAAVHGGRRGAGVRRRGRQWLGAGAGEWQSASGRGCLQCRDGSVGVSGWQGTPLGLPCSAEAIAESISGAVGSGSTGCQARVSEPSKCLYLIVDTVVLMVNSCKVDKLQNLQQELVRKVTHLLYEVWSKVRLLRSSADCSNWKDQLQSRPYEISEAIFRLSMDLAYPAHLEPDEVRKSFFGQMESAFEKFALMYWENSPYLYKIQSDLEGDTVFTALHEAFDLRAPDAIIESFIQGLVSCPAIASDELNINSFLHEVHDSLGAPVKYKQDVRVVRTPDQTSTGSGIEEHFFDDGIVFPDAAAFVEKCKGAIKNGFSIALRGMEFRSEKIAAIASALADLFGQPSVGANIYFSPPRSQGLARHYDDHCVLVWQLLGCKKWKIWPNTRSILPRLYEPFHSLDGLVDESGGRVEVLHEGDIMYVPRGHVHEACTDVDEGGSEVNASANYSLHLTLAIEVEPPFEWEGFAHIALHCWLEEQELVRSSGSVQSRMEEQAPLFALLLHVAIRLLSNDDPTLRKACMVAAKLPSSSNSLRSSYISTFAEILHNINRSCSFEDALRSIELAVKARNDEPFQWMSWLRHLPQQHGRRTIDLCDVLGPLEELLDMVSSDRERASADFAEFRSSFCGCAVVYEDARREFEALLGMYREARTRYAKGMLALHGKHGG